MGTLSLTMCLAREYTQAEVVALHLQLLKAREVHTKQSTVKIFVLPPLL